MCLIVFAWQVKPNTPLIVASNRDEFYARPALPAHQWEDYPSIYAGKDLEGGGTWLGIVQGNAENSFRFAALTNVRNPSDIRENAPTRGTLVSHFLASTDSPADYIQKIRTSATDYNGFNLLVGDASSLIWFSNKGKNHPLNTTPLKPGIYGLSNALLDDPWPKVAKTKKRFTELLNQNAQENAYFEMLSDPKTAPDEQLPNTGISYEWEKRLSAVCIASNDYGTRVSTYVEMHQNKPSILHEHIIHP